MRIEYSSDGKFNDLETSIVKNRHFDVPEFQKTENERYLFLETRYFNLTYLKNAKFDSRSLYAKIGEKKMIWYYSDKEVRNVKSTTYSLDRMVTLPVLKNGLYSPEGYATLDDSHSLLFDENSNVVGVGQNIDFYLFVYDVNFKLALQDYFKLTGYPPLIPRYALGNWWSKEYSYNAEGIMKLINKFQRRNIPLSTIILDNGWSKTDNRFPDVKLGYSFDPALYLQPQKLIQDVHEKGIKLGVKINPGYGFYPFGTHHIFIILLVS